MLDQGADPGGRMAAAFGGGAVITVYRENKKKKVPVATISNVKENISVTIDEGGNGALN